MNVPCLCCSAGLGLFHAFVHLSHNKCVWLVLPPSMEGDNIPPADDEIIAAYDGDDQVLQTAAALADFVVPHVSDEDGLYGEDPECLISQCRPQLEGSTEWCQNMSVHLRYGTNSAGVCQRSEHMHTGTIINLDTGYKWKLKFAPHGFGVVQSDLTKVWLRHLFQKFCAH